METSPSQSSGQGGGLQWSARTGHPTAVTDDFHQGAYGLTGEMYMETAAKEADIYLPVACQPGHSKKEAKKERQVQQSDAQRSGYIHFIMDYLQQIATAYTNFW